MKNYIQKIEAQMSALKSHEECELSALANKRETMSPNLWKTVNAQQDSVYKNIELLQQNFSYLQKELSSKNEMIKSLLGVQSALIETINKPIQNEFIIPRPTMEPQQKQPMSTFNLQNQPKLRNTHQSFGFRKHL